MRPATLHALADIAQRDGRAAAEILREFAGHERTLTELDNLRREADDWHRLADQRSNQRDAEEGKREAALRVLGDGWHPLKCGGAVLIENGKPTRLRDGGEHTAERQKIVLEQTRVLGFQWITPCDYDVEAEAIRWTDDGETSIEIDMDIPF